MGAVRVADPDFVRTAAIGGEGELAAIRGEARFIVLPGGEDHALGFAGLAGLERQTPDVRIGDVAHEQQAALFGKSRPAALLCKRDADRRRVWPGIRGDPVKRTPISATAAYCRGEDDFF